VFFNSDTTTTQFCSHGIPCICASTEPDRHISGLQTVTVGKCIKYIDNKEDCELAAKSLFNVQDATAYDGTGNSLPKGCYYSKVDNRLYFDSDMTNTGLCDSFDQCLCAPLPKTIACFECAAGTYSSNGKCLKCKEDSISNETGQIACTQCPNGKYQNNQGQTYCKEICKPGKALDTRFFLIESGNCETEISSEEECSLAASKNGFLPNVIRRGSYDREGCVRYMGKTYFYERVNQQDLILPCSSAASCLCKAKKDTCVACAEGKYSHGGKIDSCHDCTAFWQVSNRYKTGCLFNPVLMYIIMGLSFIIVAIIFIKSSQRYKKHVFNKANSEFNHDFQDIMNMDLLQKMRTSSLRNVGRRGNNSTARSRGLSEPLMSDMDEHIEMGKVSSSKSIDMINQQKPKEKMQEEELKTYNKEWAVLEKSIFRAETSVELIKGFEEMLDFLNRNDGGENKKRGFFKFIKGKTETLLSIASSKKSGMIRNSMSVTFKAKNRLSEKDDLLLDVEKDSDLLWNIKVAKVFGKVLLALGEVSKGEGER